MSASVSIATPHLPTSPSASASSESRPMSVGRSNAVDRPPPPAASRSLKRRLVSVAVPKPANIRIVQSFDRYISGYRPRVYGYVPGRSASAGPYTGSVGSPEYVEKSGSGIAQVSQVPLPLVFSSIPGLMTLGLGDK